MVKWIRWQGLVAFIAIVALVAGFCAAFAGTLLKWSVESTGTALVGARVQLAGASVHLFPVHVELDGLQVTDPAQPMRNAFQARRIAFGIEPGQLVMGRTFVDGMSVEGAAIDTPREHSGAVRGSAAGKRGHAFLTAAAGAAQSLGVELPSADSILKRADLHSVQQIGGLDDRLDKQVEQARRQVRGLPGDKQLQAYRERLAQIRKKTSGPLGLVRKGKQVADLRNSISSDIDRIRSTRDELSRTRAHMRSELDAARKAPGEDAQRLVNKYALGGANLDNLSALVFGPRVGRWTAQAWSWYQILRPYLEQANAGGGSVTSKPLRSPGRNVIFPRAHPQPDVLVRDIHLSALRHQGSAAVTVSGRVRDFTLQPALWPRPLTFSISGRGGSHRVAGFSMSGTLDHRHPSAPDDRLRMHLKDVRIGGGSSGRVPVTLAGGSANVDVDGHLRSGSMDFEIRTRVREASFRRTGGNGGGRIGRAIADTLENAHDFTLVAHLTGTPAQPSVQISSSLDRRLKQAVAAAIEGRLDKLRAGLRQRIEARTGDRLKAAQAKLDSLASLDHQASDRLSAYRDLLHRLQG